MPYMTPEKRRAGGWASSAVDPHQGEPCTCDWTIPTDAATLAHRRLPFPDQTRYGTAHE